MSCLENRYAVV